jgi:hypothetical protein
MALVGITRPEARDYVSETDPCRKTIQVPVDPADATKGTRDEIVIEDGATVFELGVLDVFLMGMIYDKSTSITRGSDSEDVGFQTRVNQTNIETVRYGLKGWRNFQDPAGGELAFAAEQRFVNGRAYQAVSDVCLNKLGIRLIRELAQEIKANSEVRGLEAKN